MDFLKVSFVNWKTTLAAFGVVACAVGKFITSLVDDDPQTVADLAPVIDAVMVLLVAVGLLSARDQDKSSQDSGIRK